MRFLIQRVKKAQCEVEGQITGAIEHGYCVFIGISNSDTQEVADKMIQKLIHMRIFADADGKTNCSIEDTGGSLLLVSQFTLYANCRKGNRPSFTDAGKPDFADEMYQYIIGACKQSVSNVQTGIFGADMQVSLVNDGPFTIMLDSDNLIS